MNAANQTLVLTTQPSNDPFNAGIGVTAQMGVGDVVAIAVTQYENHCETEIELWQTKLREVNADLSELNQALLQAARAAVTEKLQDHIARSRTFYEMWGLAFTSELTTVVSDAGMVDVTIALGSRKKKSSYDDEAHGLSLSKEYSLAELGLTDLRKQLLDKQRQQVEVENSLRRWKTKAAAQATFERQTRAQISAEALAKVQGGKLVNKLLKMADRSLAALPALSEQAQPLLIEFPTESETAEPTLKRAATPKKRKKARR